MVEKCEIKNKQKSHKSLKREKLPLLQYMYSQHNMSNYDLLRSKIVLYLFLCITSCLLETGHYAQKCEI